MQRKSNKTFAFAATAVLLAGLGIGFALTPGGDSDHDADAVHDADTATLTMGGEVEVMLLRIGITPEVLASSGLNSTAVQTALAAEQQDLEAATSTLATHDAACAAARKSVDALRRLVQSGQASQEEVTELATAKATLASALAARDTFLQGICMGLCANVSEGASSSVQNMIASKRWKTVPAAYRVEARTDAEWLAIRDALAAKKTHERFGDEVPAEVTQFLSTLNADGDVAAAKSSCESSLSGVQGLWDGVFAQ